MKTTPTAPRKEEEIIPSAPVPARTERRVNTTQPQPHPGSGPEDLSGPEPLLPHERDEDTSMTHPEVAARIHQAAKDLERGLKDTSRANETDQAYHRLVAARGLHLGNEVGQRAFR